MNELTNIKITYTKLLKWLLSLMLFSYSLNILTTYFFSVNNAHTIITIVLLLVITSFLIKKGKIVVNILFVNIILYITTLIIGLNSKDLNIINILRTFNYRLMFPILFFLLFSLDFNGTSKFKIGLNVIKIINAVSVIFSAFALIEFYNPSLIYSLYNNVTTHLNLFLADGGVSTRLVSLAGNPINLGFYLVLGLGSSFTLLFLNQRKSQLYSLYHLIMIALFLYVLFYTYSRGAMLLALVIIVIILLLTFREKGTLNKITVIFLFSILIFGTVYLLGSSLALSSRVTQINLQSFTSNLRFQTASNAFNKDTSVLQYIFGHGITAISDSYSYVFEFGYASLLYESGIIGFVSVIGSFILGIFNGLKKMKYLNSSQKDIATFYIAVIFSGLAGMLVEDVYMQQPYSIYLWFSTMFLASLNFNTKTKNRLVHDDSNTVSSENSKSFLIL